MYPIDLPRHHQKEMTMTPAQWRQAGLHGGTFLTGIIAAISFMASSGIDLYAAYNHAYAGVKELMAAWAIIGPVLLGGYAVYKASTKNTIADVAKAPDALQAARSIVPTPQVVAVADALKNNER